MEKTKQAAIDFINNGGKCVYRYGWGWKGAGANYKTKDRNLLARIPIW